jgi:hypothetical protein
LPASRRPRRTRDWVPVRLLDVYSHQISRHRDVSPIRFPIDELYRVDFLPGQYFDIRLEVHAPINGSQATGNLVPDSSFTFSIAKAGGQAQSTASYFGISEPSVEHWNFTWFEGNAFHTRLTHLQCILSSLRAWNIHSDVDL